MVVPVLTIEVRLPVLVRRRHPEQVHRIESKRQCPPGRTAARIAIDAEFLRGALVRQSTITHPGTQAHVELPIRYRLVTDQQRTGLVEFLAAFPIDRAVYPEHNSRRESRLENPIDANRRLAGEQAEAIYGQMRTVSENKRRSLASRLG